MISAVIIDDEKNNIENLHGLLQKYCPGVQVAGFALNAADGKKIIEQYQPGIVFLDIQMPGKNGFDLLQSLPQRRFEIVFVTAFDQYGIQAVKFSAIDYLLKPVNTSELQLAVEKAILKSAIKTENLQLQNLVTLLQQRQQKSVHRLVLSTAKETKFVNPEEIIRCESSNTYTSFYIVGEQKIMVSKPIFEYEELLKDYGFIRCHQSHLINMAKVKSWLKENGSELLLQDGSRVPVSRNKKEIVAAALKTFKLP